MKATAAERRVGIRRRTQFDLLSAHFMRGLDLLRIRIDKEAREYSCLSQTTHGGTHDRDVASYVKTAFGSYFVRIFRDQRYSVRPNFKSNLQHLFGRGHLHIQI